MVSAAGVLVSAGLIIGKMASGQILGHGPGMGRSMRTHEQASCRQRGMSVAKTRITAPDRGEA